MFIYKSTGEKNGSMKYQSTLKSIKLLKLML